MKLYYKHTPKGNLWIYWVRHNGFGKRPRLKINWVYNGRLFRFIFTWWKLEAYLSTSAKREQ